MPKNVNSKQIKVTSYFPVWTDFPLVSRGLELLVGQQVRGFLSGRYRKDDALLTISKTSCADRESR